MRTCPTARHLGLFARPPLIHWGIACHMPLHTPRKYVSPRFTLKLPRIWRRATAKARLVGDQRAIRRARGYQYASTV